jgi:hypothetical protein
MSHIHRRYTDGEDVTHSLKDRQRLSLILGDRTDLFIAAEKGCCQRGLVLFTICYSATNGSDF